MRLSTIALIALALSFAATGAFGQEQPPATPVSELSECEPACKIPIAKMCANEIDAIERTCTEQLLFLCVEECVTDLAAGGQVAITTDFAAQRAYESRQSDERHRQLMEELERERQANRRRLEECEARQQQAFQAAEAQRDGARDREREEYKRCETQYRMLHWDEEGYRPGINNERWDAQRECIDRVHRESDRRSREIDAPWRQIEEECRKIRYGG